MSNLHSLLPDDQIHHAKGFQASVAGKSLWKNEQNAQEFDKVNSFPPCLKVVDSSIAPPTENDNDIYIIDNARGSLDVDSISWQSANTIRYTFNGIPDLSTYLAGDFIKVDSATNEINNGSFELTAINDGANWVEVSNTLRNSNTDDEASDSPAVATSTLSNWDGCPQNSWVRYDSVFDSWSPVTPYVGVVCYNVYLEKHIYFNGVEWIGVGESVLSYQIWRDNGSPTHLWKVTMGSDGMLSLPGEDLGVG